MNVGVSAVRAIADAGQRGISVCRWQPVIYLERGFASDRRVVIAALASLAAIVVVVVVVVTKDEKGKVLQTSLTKDKEDALRAVIEGIY